jgi:hypothetical protein
LSHGPNLLLLLAIFQIGSHVLSSGLASDFSLPTLHIPSSWDCRPVLKFELYITMLSNIKVTEATYTMKNFSNYHKKVKRKRN